jgi:hypothetical protein
MVGKRAVGRCEGFPAVSVEGSHREPLLLETAILTLQPQMHSHRHTSIASTSKAHKKQNRMKEGGHLLKQLIVERRMGSI